MKVMYVTPGLGRGGGAERSLSSLVSHWRDVLDLEVVTFSDRAELAGDIVDAGAMVTNLSGQSMREVIPQLRRLVKTRRPDLVHSVLFDADLAARLATPISIPVSGTWAGFNYGPTQRLAPGISGSKLRLAQALDAATAQRVSRFHAVSCGLADTMSRRLLVPRSKVDVVPRGRSRAGLGVITAERRQAVRRRLGLDLEPLVVTAARHQWVKGLDVLVSAIPRIKESVPNLVVLMAGPSGHDTPRLKRLIADLGINPERVLIGKRNDIPDLLSAADVVCIPSRSEGCCNVMVEAMGLGAPVVAAGIPALLELDPLRSWARFFEPEHSEALAHEVITALSQRDSAARAEYAITRFEKSYQSDKIAGQMLTFFRKAARIGSGAGPHRS